MIFPIGYNLVFFEKENYLLAKHELIKEIYII